MTDDWEAITYAMEIEPRCAHWKRKAAEHIVYPYKISMHDIQTYVYDAVISQMYVRHKHDDEKRKPEENGGDEEERIVLPTSALAKRATASIAAANREAYQEWFENEHGYPPTSTAASSSSTAAAKADDTQQHAADDDDGSDVGDLDSFLDGIEDMLNEDEPNP